MGKKKTAFEVPEIGVRLSENPEHWPSSRYYRGRIARFFLFFCIRLHVKKVILWVAVYYLDKSRKDVHCTSFLSPRL
jgi:hypothetical protein